MVRVLFIAAFCVASACLSMEKKTESSAITQNYNTALECSVQSIDSEVCNDFVVLKSYVQLLSDSNLKKGSQVYIYWPDKFSKSSAMVNVRSTKLENFYLLEFETNIDEKNIDKFSIEGTYSKLYLKRQTPILTFLEWAKIGRGKFYNTKIEAIQQIGENLILIDFELRDDGSCSACREIAEAVEFYDRNDRPIKVELSKIEEDLYGFAANPNSQVKKLRFKALVASGYYKLLLNPPGARKIEILFNDEDLLK